MALNYLRVEDISSDLVFKKQELDDMVRQVIQMCIRDRYDGMVFCLVLFNGKSYLFYVSRFYEKGHTAG